jgi:hypothetical protein
MPNGNAPGTNIAKANGKFDITHRDSQQSSATVALTGLPASFTVQLLDLQSARGSDATITWLTNYELSNGPDGTPYNVEIQLPASVQFTKVWVFKPGASPKQRDFTRQNNSVTILMNSNDPAIGIS